MEKKVLVSQSFWVSVYLCLSVYLFVCCTVCFLYFCHLLVCLSVSLHACFSVCSSIYLSAELPAGLPDSLCLSLPLCPSLHRPPGARVSPREQHSRRPASEDRLWWRRCAEGFCEPRGTLLPERKRFDGEERTRLWGALSKSGTFIACTAVSSFRTL